MAQVLVRELETETLEKLKGRARSNNRSLEAELRVILRQAVAPAESAVESRSKAMSPEILAEVARIRALFDGQKFPDSAELLREDRDR